MRETDLVKPSFHDDPSPIIYTRSVVSDEIKTHEMERVRGSDQAKLSIHGRLSIISCRYEADVLR